MVGPLPAALGTHSSSQLTVPFKEHTNNRDEEGCKKLSRTLQERWAVQYHNTERFNSRWDSKYYMVERLLEQRWPVTATIWFWFYSKGQTLLCLKPDQWVLCKELTQGLEPFECAILYLNRQECTTISCLQQLVKGLQRSVQQTLCFEKSPWKTFFLASAG